MARDSTEWNNTTYYGIATVSDIKSYKCMNAFYDTDFSSNKCPTLDNVYSDTVVMDPGEKPNSWNHNKLVPFKDIKVDTRSFSISIIIYNNRKSDKAQLNKDYTKLQYRKVGDTTWIDLVTRENSDIDAGSQDSFTLTVNTSEWELDLDDERYECRLICGQTTNAQKWKTYINDALNNDQTSSKVKTANTLVYPVQNGNSTYSLIRSKNRIKKVMFEIVD